MLYVQVPFRARVFRGHIPEPRADKYQSRFAVREAAHDTGPATDFPVETFLDTVSPDAVPMPV